jgi:hypothetical protein
MHIDQVNLPAELKDDSLELQRQAKDDSLELQRLLSYSVRHSHNDYEEKQNSQILVNMSLLSDLTFHAQIEKVLSFCKQMSW